MTTAGPCAADINQAALAVFDCPAHVPGEPPLSPMTCAAGLYGKRPPRPETGS